MRTQLRAQAVTELRHRRVCFVTPHLGQQLLHLVPALQQQGHALIAQGDLTAAHAFQQAFNFMGEVNHRLKPKQAGRAFDGVRCAKGAIHGLRVTRVLLHGQQRFLKLAQHVLGFVEEAFSGYREDFVI